MVSRLRRIILQLITICLLLMNAANVSAQGAAEGIKIQKPISLGKVTLKENVSAEITNLMIKPADNRQMIAFTLTIQNNSNSDLNFIDYWINLYTKSGSKLNLQMLTTDSNTVPAKTIKSMQFYGYVGTNIQLNDLIFKVIKWDFFATDYSKVLGQLTVPQRYNPVTPANNGRIVNVGNVNAAIVINNSVIGKSEQYYRPNLEVLIKNQGNSTITLPDYQMYIQTSDNLIYPLSSSKEINGVKLNALTEEEFRLTSSIPISVKEGNWKLLVTYTVNEGKDEIPAALFQLPGTKSEVADDLNQFYAFTNSDGVYYIKLNSLNRLPLEDNDLIIANVTLANKGDETLPIPELSGKYIFNDNIEKNVTVSSNEKVIALQSDEMIDMQIVTQVPYTFDISKVNLIVQQKDTGSSDTYDLVEFSHSGTFAEIETVSANQGFKITDVGYRSEVKVRNLYTYSGSTADILAAQITITNEEKRLADSQQLAGYFEKDDGTVYPATIQSIKDKLSPGGKAIIYAWATVPKNLDVTNIKLVVGKAVLETLAGKNGTSDPIVAGYVKPYAFNLPEEKTVQESLQMIDFLPYTLSIERVRTQVNFQDKWLKLDFDYNLEQDLLTKAELSDEQKIIIELKDNKNETTAFSQELSMPETGNGGNVENTLKTGNNTMEITWNGDEILNIQASGDYSFNVYQQFKAGYKKLIATHDIPWLVNRSISGA